MERRYQQRREGGNRGYVGTGEADLSLFSLSSFSSDGSNPLTRLSGLNLGAAGENVAGGQTNAQWAMGEFDEARLENEFK